MYSGDLAYRTRFHACVNRHPWMFVGILFLIGVFSDYCFGGVN